MLAASLVEELLTSFNNFVTKMKEMASRGKDKGLGDWLDNQDVCQMLNISPRTLQTLRDCVNLPKSVVFYNLFRNFARTKDRYVQPDSGRYPLYDIICCSGGYGHDSRLLSLVSQSQRYSPQHLSTYTPTPVDGDIPYILGIESSVVYAAVFPYLKRGC